VFGKNSHLNQLASRKKLLIAESELNRAQLVQEWQTLADEAHALADQARTIRSLATAGASLMAGLVSLRQKRSAPSAGKTSWLQNILKSAGQISTLWSVFRPPPDDRGGS
jgi:hypothetical protein